MQYGYGLGHVYLVHQGKRMQLTWEYDLRSDIFTVRLPDGAGEIEIGADILDPYFTGSDVRTIAFGKGGSRE